MSRPLLSEIDMREETESVQEMVTWLIESAGMKPPEIADALDNRVSGRTIYRWSKGESQPGNSTDHDELVALVQSHKPKKQPQKKEETA